MFYERIFGLGGSRTLLVDAHGGADGAGWSYARDKTVAENRLLFEGIPEPARFLHHVVPLGAQRNLFADALFEALYRVARGKRIFVRQVLVFVRVRF